MAAAIAKSICITGEKEVVWVGEEEWIRRRLLLGASSLQVMDRRAAAKSL